MLRLYVSTCAFAEVIGVPALSVAQWIRYGDLPDWNPALVKPVERNAS
jgi:hypothetical protein